MIVLLYFNIFCFNILFFVIFFLFIFFNFTENIIFKKYILIDIIKFNDINIIIRDILILKYTPIIIPIIYDIATIKSVLLILIPPFKLSLYYLFFLLFTS